MSRACLVCAPQPFATTSRSGFSRRRCARMANAATTTVRFIRLAVVQRAVRRGSPWRKYASYSSGSPPGTRPPKRWHQLSQRKIAELRERMKRLSNGDVAQARGGLSLRRTRRVRRKNSSTRSRLNSESSDSLAAWAGTTFPMAVRSFEKRIEKTCRLRARNAPAQLSR